MAAKRKRFQRARSDEAKQVRRDAILAAALRAFERHSYDEITVDRVARDCGLAKGTVYLYFPTKEAIFLELLLDHLTVWFAALERPLGELARAVPAGEGARAQAAAALLAASMGERPSLRRLLSILHQTLERNVDVATVRAFKLHLAAVMAPTAGRLEACLPQLGPGEGFRLLIHLHAAVIGVGQMADNSDVVAEVLRASELAGFRVDFAAELRELLTRLLSGWRARASID